MAPINNSAKALQQNRPRPAVAKAIVPAIPLTYVQKRQKQQIARAKVEPEEVLPASPVVAESPASQSSAPQSPVPQSPKSEIIVANGTSSLEKEEHVKAQQIEEQESSVASTSSVSAEEVTESAEESVTLVEEEPTADPQQTPRSAPSEAQSSTSRSTYQLPPAFVPSTNTQYPTMSSGTPNFPPPPNFNTQHPMHHAHPSAGSLRFGGYPESNNSSPAPPPSAGNLPPYPFHQQPPQHNVGRHGPHQSNGGHLQYMPNGYSPMGPPPPPGYHYPRPDMMNHGPGVEQYARRQMGQFAPPEGYSPSATPMGAENYRYSSFDPSTPHSFQGSQSSAPNEHDNSPAFYNQYSHPTPVVNGSNGHINEAQAFQQSRQKTHPTSQTVPTVSNAYHPSPMMQPPPMPEDRYDGLVQYLQNQFGDPAFADYTLELRYSDDRAPAVRIPGHNIMFARSPALKSLMLASHREANGDGVTAKTLFIESGDRFLRSDGFWLAMQRLYGGFLLDLGQISALNAVPSPEIDSHVSGTRSDRFDFALGYAAAGHILQIPPVINRGIEIAGQFINWSTIERALDFALDGGLDCSWTLQPASEQGRCPCTYGPTVNLLLQQALNFVITTFHPSFKLDTHVGDFAHNRRLPDVPAEEDPPRNHTARLSRITFGDHPSEESAFNTTSLSENAIRSRILLNLPYHLLKYVLESSKLGNVSGWSSTKVRNEAIDAVVNERERRRLTVKNHAGVPNHVRVQDEKSWEVVAWAESVEPSAGPNGAHVITRTKNDALLPKTAL